MGVKSVLTRRRFLAWTGAAVGGAIVTCGGLTALGLYQPPVKFVQSNCRKEEGVTNKILVAFASKCGSTGQIAEAIGKVMCEAGAEVDVKPIKQVSGIEGYQAVVIGTAIRIGQCLPEAKKFIENYRDPLSRLPLAYFAVCLSIVSQNAEERQQAEGYLDPLKALVEPKAAGIFAGVMDCKKLPFLARIMIRMMRIDEGDFCNWDAIRAWATDLYPRLV